MVLSRLTGAYLSGGILLSTIGRWPYYVIAGIVRLAFAWLMLRRCAYSLVVYAVRLVVILACSVAESGTDLSRRFQIGMPGPPIMEKIN